MKVEDDTKRKTAKCRSAYCTDIMQSKAASATSRIYDLSPFEVE